MIIVAVDPQCDTPREYVESVLVSRVIDVGKYERAESHTLSQFYGKCTVVMPNGTLEMWCDQISVEIPGNYFLCRVETLADYVDKLAAWKAAEAEFEEAHQRYVTAQSSWRGVNQPCLVDANDPVRVFEVEDRYLVAVLDEHGGEKHHLVENLG